MTAVELARSRFPEQWNAGNEVLFHNSVMLSFLPDSCCDAPGVIGLDSCDEHGYVTTTRDSFNRPRWIWSSQPRTRVSFQRTHYLEKLLIRRMSGAMPLFSAYRIVTVDRFCDFALVPTGFSEPVLRTVLVLLRRATLT